MKKQQVQVVLGSAKKSIYMWTSELGAGRFLRVEEKLIQGVRPQYDSIEELQADLVSCFQLEERNIPLSGLIDLKTNRIRFSLIEDSQSKNVTAEQEDELNSLGRALFVCDYEIPVTIL